MFTRSCARTLIFEPPAAEDIIIIATAVDSTCIHVFVCLGLFIVLIVPVVLSIALVIVLTVPVVLPIALLPQFAPLKPARRCA